MKIGYLPGVKSWYNNNIFIDIDNFDNRKDPFLELKQKLSREDILIKTLDNTFESFDYLIIHRIDINLGLLFNYLLHNPNTKLIYVVTEEPAIVSFHKPNLIKYFKFDFVLIYETNEISNFYQFQYPNPKLVYNCVNNFKLRQLLCAIVRLKRSNPFHKNSLYKTRNRYIKNLLKFDQFHLYGAGWYFKESNYFGEIKSKSEVLSKYRFSLVIENSITKNFLTEKILDCMVHGTVPVYYGCENVSHYIPQNCFIKLDIFLDSSEQLVEYLENISESQWNEINHNIKIFLNSKMYADLTSEGFIDIIFTIIKTNIKGISKSPNSLWFRSLYVLLISPVHLLTKSGLKMLLDIVLFPFNKLIYVFKYSN